MSDDILGKQFFEEEMTGTETVEVKRTKKPVKAETKPEEPVVNDPDFSIFKILQFALMFTNHEGIYSNIFMSKNKILTTNESNIFISHDVKVPDAIVSASQILRFLKIVEYTNIQWIDADNFLTIKADKLRFRIPKVFSPELPNINTIFGMSKKKFMESKFTELKITERELLIFKSLLFASAKDTDTKKPECNGIHFTKSGYYTSDGYRLAGFKTPTEVETPFTLPYKLCEFMVMFGFPPKSFKVTDSYTITDYGKFTIITALNPFKFICDPDQMFGGFDFNNTIKIEFKETESEKLSIIKKLAIVQDNRVNFTIEDDKCYMSVTDKIGTAINIEIETEITTTNELRINTGLLYVAGGFVRSDTMYISPLSEKRVQILFANTKLNEFNKDFLYMIAGTIIGS